MTDDLSNVNGVDDDDLPMRSISAAGLDRMARQKKDLTNQMAGAAKEVEHLRLRQEQLERERRDLANYSKQQTDYEQGKRDITGKLNQAIILVEKEEIQATRMRELLSETSVRFKKMLSELAEIDEESWADENFQVELNRALVRVDIASSDYKKAMAKIEASSWHKGLSKKMQSEAQGESLNESGSKKSFGYWLKVGLGVGLPMMLFLLALFTFWLYLMGLFPGS